MIYGLWQSAGGLAAQEYRQSILSNNLANVETPGFKPDRVSFFERLSASRLSNASASDPVLRALSGGVYHSEVHTDFSPAPLSGSESNLDVAIHGQGFLKVQTDDGPAYTRDGRMIADRAGMLIHAASGHPVLSVDGRQIAINPLSRAGVQIDETGRVRQGADVLGRLAVVDFENPQQLRKSGESLFRAEGAKEIESRAEVRQGYVEASGVNAVSALVEMIAASRAYQTNATMISLQDQSLARVVNDVGRIG